MTAATGDAAHGWNGAPPDDDPRCAEFYADGYEDGGNGTYDPPRE